MASLLAWCNSCGSAVATELDEINGGTCCTSCGQVLEENVNSQPTVSNDAGGQSRSFVRDGHYRVSTLGAGGRTGGIRMQVSSHDRTIDKGKQEIERIAERLNVRPGRDDAVSAALRFYALAVGKSFTRGRRTEQVAGACLYVVCRLEGKPYMLLDYADCLQTNVYVLGAVYLQLCGVLRLEEHPVIVRPVDPSLFIHRFADRLRCGGKTHAVAATALRLVASMKRDWMQTGRKPNGICGAALYIAAHVHGFQRGKSDVVDVVRIGEGTLKKRLDEFGSTEAANLTAEEFEVKAKEIELQMRSSATTVLESAAVHVLCEHKEVGAPHFAHGLCRGCYDEFARVAGGLEGGSDPPAFQRAEKQLRVNSEEAEHAHAQTEKIGNELAHQVHVDRQEEERVFASALEGTLQIVPGLNLIPDEGSDQDKDENNQQPSCEDENEPLSDLDHDECEEYILGEEEVKLKTELWERMNEEYLKAEEAKRNVVAAATLNLQVASVMLTSQGDLVSAVAHSISKKKGDRKRKREEEANNKVLATSASEAVQQMFKSNKKLSSKVNYDELDKLLNDCSTP